MSLLEGPLDEFEFLVAWSLIVFKISFLTKEVLGKSLALGSTRVHGALRTGDIGASAGTTQSCIAGGGVDTGLIADEGSCIATFFVGRLRRMNGRLMLGNVMDWDIHDEGRTLLCNVQMRWDKRLVDIVHVGWSQPCWVAGRR